MNIRNILNILSIALIVYSCGDPGVQIDESSYAPKIVIEGYLFPNSKPSNIKISRNFPLNTTIDSSTIFIKNASVQIYDETNNKYYPLSFDQKQKSYFYPFDDLIIQYNKKYKLIVDAVIEGKTLSANSETLTPQKGFKVDRNLSIIGDIRYREKYSDGSFKKFRINFNQSPGIDFYVVGTKAMNAARETFINENTLVRDTAHFFENINQRTFQYNWLQNIDVNFPNNSLEFEWFTFFFYGKYMVVMYAGDKNFKDYMITHGFIMEIDGNLHEPRFHINGDGIGVFGSAIADTVYFNVLK